MFDNGITKRTIFGNDLEVFAGAVLGACREPMSGQGIGDCVQRALKGPVRFAWFD